MDRVLVNDAKHQVIPKRGFLAGILNRVQQVGVAKRGNRNINHGGLLYLKSSQSFQSRTYRL